MKQLRREVPELLASPASGSAERRGTHPRLFSVPRRAQTIPPQVDLGEPALMLPLVHQFGEDITVSQQICTQSILSSAPSFFSLVAMWPTPTAQ
jgi:hypothetical protein